MDKKAERFVFWRRAPEELNEERRHNRKNLPVISTYENKLKEAKEIVAEGQYETVMILEIKQVIRRKPPVVDVDIEEYGELENKIEAPTTSK